MVRWYIVLENKKEKETDLGVVFYLPGVWGMWYSKQSDFYISNETGGLYHFF
jgi:hypothetical protein